MRAGLPSTSETACKALLCALLASALEEGDIEFVMSENFEKFARLVGFDDLAIFRTRLKAVLGLIDRRRFHGKTMDSLRRGAERPEDPIFWSSWKAMPR